MAQTTEVISDGWIVTNQRAFRILIDHAPPRPWGFLDQIRSDCCEPKIIWLWVRGLFLTIVGGGLAVAGVATQQWPLILGVLLFYRGLWLLSVWVRLARSVIRRFRMHPIAIGVISGFEPHPIVSAIIKVGRASRPTGEFVDVAAEVPLAQAIIAAGFPAEVWFLDDPTWQYQTIFAGRPTCSFTRDSALHNGRKESG